MNPEWILRVVLIGITHWVLAGLLLQDLANRPKVVGGKKWVWALVIILITVLGSLLYLSFHPQVFYPQDHGQTKK